MDDKSGIFSLGGFAYQIRVFVYLIPMIRSGESISFEAIDDVSTNLNPEDLDNYDDDVICADGYGKAIQVKKTNINISVAKKVFKNWMKISFDHPNVKKYVLYTDRHDVDYDIFTKISLVEILSEVRSSTSSRSIDGKLKAIGFSDTEFTDKAKDVLDNLEIITFKASDDDIKTQYDIFFMRNAISEFTYAKRIEQFISAITLEILDEIRQGRQYTLDRNHISVLQNKMVIDITDEHMNLPYANFKKIHKVDLDDLSISQSREYKQLCECKLDKMGIERNLFFEHYYKECRMNYYGLGKRDIVDDIELTAYENYCDTKEFLQLKGEDTPRNRLDLTKRKSNTRATNEQIKYGVCIDLTKAETPDNLKISWKDEDDE